MISTRSTEATFYPFNAESIRFPSIGLEMIKFKCRQEPFIFGQNRQEDFKMFYSKPENDYGEGAAAALAARCSIRWRLLAGLRRLRNKELTTGQSVGYEVQCFW